jgi:hypothetical protein
MVTHRCPAGQRALPPHGISHEVNVGPAAPAMPWYSMQVSPSAQRPASAQRAP